MIKKKTVMSFWGIFLLFFYTKDKMEALHFVVVVRKTGIWIQLFVPQKESELQRSVSEFPSGL